MNLTFCVFWCCLWWSSSANKSRFMRLVGVGEPNSPETARTLIIENKWFEQKLDHFNPTDTRTWKQMYQMNSKYYKSGGPVFLNIGGEEEISSSWMSSGAWIEYAKKYNALCFQLEHRYYGRSHPTENLNATNLVYLTIEQALADLGSFINTIRNENRKLLINTKWVAFGGSYSGSLAAWLRMKYPHLVHAAVSSSSCLRAKINYKEYFIVAQNALSNYNPKCVTHIKEATAAISDLLNTENGVKYIDEKFKTCRHGNLNDKKDRTQFFKTLSYSIGLVVQYNDDNRYIENARQSLLSIPTLCDMMLDKSLGNSLDRYATVHEKLRSIYGNKCLSSSYKSALSIYQETSWNAQFVKSGSLQWMYQLCTEIGDFVTSNEDDHLFGNTIPLDYYTDKCRDIFGKSFSINALYKAAWNTNMMYFDLKKKTSRIIYLHGSIDPWNKLGLIQTQAKNSVSIFIEGASHGADVYPSRSSDPPQLSKARKTVTFCLKKWLKESDVSQEKI